MANDGFDSDSWIARLAGALESLAEVQQEHWEELYGRHAGRSNSDESLDPSEGYRSFYVSAAEIESRILERRYGSVRAALTDTKDILSEHPAWAVPPGSSGNGEVWLEFPSGGGTGAPSAIIGGLMARGLEAGQDGFRTACSELNLLLEPGDAEDRDPVREELLTGYHVVLFQGLIVSEEIGIGDELTIVPFGQLDELLHAGALERLAPQAGRRGGKEVLAAIVKPFGWKPKVRRDGDLSPSDWSEIDEFFRDAEVLIELLALFHGEPVVRLASIPWRLHRRACRLLGNMGVHRSYGAKVPAGWPGVARGPVKARREAINAAARGFADRGGERYRHCAPVIVRLAEALARQGRFRNEDRILDVPVALERMYELDQGEISFKLKTRAACFLETQTKNRLRVFKDVQELYDARSGIVHSRGRKGKKAKPKEQLEQERRAAFDKGFDVARRSVVKLLKEKPPPDWNEMLLEAKEERPGGRRSGENTTAQGYTNKNGQTVIRRTDTRATTTTRWFTSWNAVDARSDTARMGRTSGRENAQSAAAESLG